MLSMCFVSVSLNLAGIRITKTLMKVRKYVKWLLLFTIKITMSLQILFLLLWLESKVIKFDPTKQSNKPLSTVCKIFIEEEHL